MIGNIWPMLGRLDDFMQLARVSWPKATYRPRWTTTPSVVPGVIPYGQIDPHDPVAAGIPRCTCWDANRQLAQPRCPLCYGVGWQGGFNSEIGVRVFFTHGVYTLKDMVGGEIQNEGDTWCQTAPDVILLANDVLILNDDYATKYIVGSERHDADFGVTYYGRMVQLFKMADNHPLFGVPIQPQDS